MSGYIYLASPYSHPDPKMVQARYEAVVRCAGFMMRNGVIVFSPIAHSHPIAMAVKLPVEWSYWERIDRAFLDRADSLMVLKLDGWETSVGVTAEIAMATNRDMLIQYMDVDQDMQVAA